MTELSELGPSSSKEMEVDVEGEAMKSSLKVLTSLAKRPEVDIEFYDLTYTVDVGRTSEKKKILKGISGAFPTGKLTAILGPSGAGKSSLMSVLIGLNTIGVSGNLLVNGKERDVKLFHKLSCYIMQEDLMQEGITVEEAMGVAAKLKLGVELRDEDKTRVVEEVLKTLGLDVCRKVRTENLSGGQKKRLAVALELVNNPPVIFLDEPTSGLDIVSTKHCIAMLKYLAHCGRTIVCTIHQPSASVLSLFDNVYILAAGQCVYQGEPDRLVNFLNKAGYECPLTHNPTDYIMETLQTEADNIKALSAAIDNGKLCERRDETASLMITKKDNVYNDKNNIAIGAIANMNFPTSFFTQFRILLKRMIVQKFRNRGTLYIQILHHILSAFLLGGLFYNIGNDGALSISNFKFCLSMIVFFMYTYVMIPVLLYPTEFELLKREYFNRWYSLKAYYAALTIANIPIMVAFGIVFLYLTYYLSGQLMETNRFLLFSAVSLLTGYCSEGFGLAIGSVFKVRDGSIVAPGLVSPLLALCFYGIGFGPTIELSMKILMRFAYLRFAISGISIAIYENRDKLDCEALYCHYADPNIFLRDLGMKDSKYIYEFLGLVAYTIIFRLMSYGILRYRLQTEFKNKFLKYISRFLRYQ